jgi:hypothetical protein
VLHTDEYASSKSKYSMQGCGYTSADCMQKEIIFLRQTPQRSPLTGASSGCCRKDLTHPRSHNINSVDLFAAKHTCGCILCDFHRPFVFWTPKRQAAKSNAEPEGRFSFVLNKSIYTARSFI